MFKQATRFLATSLALSAIFARAQALPAEGEDAMPMSDYLGLLSQIAPAARQGAEAYLGAYRQRCGRALTTAGLRHAMSKEGGEPTLMAMIRASQLQNTRSIEALAGTISCRDSR